MVKVRGCNGNCVEHGRCRDNGTRGGIYRDGGVGCGELL